MTNSKTTQALLPVTLPKGRIKYAPGVRAGDWVFATGHKGTADYVSGISPDVVASVGYGGTKHRREADQVFTNLSGVLSAGGSSLENVVRVDQNFASGRAVEAYHDARRAVLKDHIPPSTSTLAEGFLLRDQDMEVHMIAVVPGNGFRPRHIRPANIEVHHTSGYSVALEVGDFVFISGRVADSPTLGDGIAQEARFPEGHQWKGLPIKLQTEFIVRSKIEPALKAAGSSLDNIVKCQVYMSDREDFGAFNEIWAQLFPRGKPAITLIPTPTPGFYLSDARIEINTIALRDDGQTRKETIGSHLPAGVITGELVADLDHPVPGGHAHAVRAGDLLFLSGLLAIDQHGLIDDAKIDPAQPYFGSSIAAQMRAMLNSAQKLCGAAGTSLANVVRIQQYHTDLADFQAAYEIWQEIVPGLHLPLSAVKVPFLPAPGCVVQLDLWVYAPA